MMKIFGSLAVWFLLAASACAQVSPARNLAADAKEAEVKRLPIVLFYSMEGCHFCRGVLREVLGPMLKDPGWQRSAIYRQINVDESTSLVDWQGKPTNHQKFAGKRLAPTLVVMGSDGKPMGEPIVGVANWDFYAYYVEEQIKSAYLKLNP